MTLCYPLAGMFHRVLFQLTFISNEADSVKQSIGAEIARQTGIDLRRSLMSAQIVLGRAHTEREISTEAQLIQKSCNSVATK